MSADEADVLVAARRGSPLVIGRGDSENLIASDASALISHTRQVIYLHDNDLAVITRDNVDLKNLDNEQVQRETEEITFDIEQIEKGGYAHFMLKEIHEQPETVLNAMRGRLILEDGISKMGGISGITDSILGAKRFIITACGTSWHAALVGKYIIEQCARIPVEVDYASEFRYRSPVLLDGDVVWAISQSGETLDTLAAMRESKQAGIPSYGIVNVVGQHYRARVGGRHLRSCRAGNRCSFDKGVYLSARCSESPKSLCRPQKRNVERVARKRNCKGNSIASGKDRIDSEIARMKLKISRSNLRIPGTFFISAAGLIFPLHSKVH